MVNEFNDLELMGISSNTTPVRLKLNEMVAEINGVSNMCQKAMSGDMVFKCYPDTNIETAVNQNRGAGAKQKETLTPVIVGDTVLEDKTIYAEVISSEHSEGIYFDIDKDDTVTDVVSAIKTAFATVPWIADNFNITGTTTLILEAKVQKANDPNLRVKLEGSEEVASTISANTVTGVAPYVREVVVQLEDSDGNIHDWFNANITVTVAETTAGNGAIAVANLTPAMVNGVTTVPITFSGTFAKGTAQVETATVEGTITKAGDALVTITSKLYDVAVTELVAVEIDDNASAIAGKIRTDLANNADITEHFTVSGENAAVVLTAKVNAANDETLNISIENGTGEGACEGITDDTSSDNTTAGVAPDTNTLSVSQATILGYTVSAATSVQTTS